MLQKICKYSQIQANLRAICAKNLRLRSLCKFCQVKWIHHKLNNVQFRIFYIIWPSLLYTVLRAGFSIFVYWSFAVNRLHNLRPCTGFLFLVNSSIYYGLYTVFFFYLQMDRPFPVAFFVHRNIAAYLPYFRCTQWTLSVF